MDKTADRIRWGYLTAFILLLASYILTFYTTQKVIEQQKQVIYTLDVINTLDDLITELRDAESAARGYLMLKDNRLLSEYNRTPRIIDSTLKVLGRVTRDNLEQKKTIDTLKTLIKTKTELNENGILFFKNNKNSVNDTLIKIGFQGKEVMDNIKKLIAAMQLRENTLIAQRSEKLNTITNFIKVINVVSLVIAIVLAFYTIISYNNEIKKRRIADKTAAEFRSQLEGKVNELSELNKELKELKSIEKFAATGRISRTIAHEVRNPLTNINLATEHLKADLDVDEDAKLLLDMITRNSNRINDLISELLNSTKAAHLNFIKVPVTEVLNSSLEYAHDRIELKKITLKKMYSRGLQPILADTDKLCIAFLNIMVNAIEAMKADEGILTIKAEDINNRCVVTISDNGAGMNDDSLSKLFEPYFTTKERGTGLGLTNTQNIILGHGAKILAESEEGAGTAFIISFNYA